MCLPVTFSQRSPPPLLPGLGLVPFVLESAVSSHSRTDLATRLTLMPVSGEVSCEARVACTWATHPPPVRLVSVGVFFVSPSLCSNPTSSNCRQSAEAEEAITVAVVVLQLQEQKQELGGAAVAAAAVETRSRSGDPLEDIDCLAFWD